LVCTDTNTARPEKAWSDCHWVWIPGKCGESVNTGLDYWTTELTIITSTSGMSAGWDYTSDTLPSHFMQSGISS